MIDDEYMVMTSSGSGDDSNGDDKFSNGSGDDGNNGGDDGNNGGDDGNDGGDDVIRGGDEIIGARGDESGDDGNGDDDEIGDDINVMKMVMMKYPFYYIFIFNEEYLLFKPGKAILRDSDKWNSIVNSLIQVMCMPTCKSQKLPA